jgi:hypothetical protein
VPDNTLPGWSSGANLAGGLSVGIVPGCLPGNGKGKRGATMIELSKMSVKKL